MSAPRIKICGLTSLADARLAHKTGADWLGFVLAPSPRRVTAEQARAIGQALPDARRVGVFVDASLGVMLEAVRTAGFDAVQLHGGEEPSLARALLARAGPPLQLIRAVRVRSPGEIQAAGRPWAELDGLTGLIVEPLAEARPSWRWAEAREPLARLARPGLTIFVAGGLTPDSVARALHDSGADGADVASGVEASPGRKDPGRLRAFVAACRTPIEREVCR